MRSRLAMVSAVLAVLVTLVSAQTNQLSGTARDLTGNVLPGVTVVLNNPAVDVSQTVTTNKDGKFTFKGLPADDGYVVTFSLLNFRTVTRRGVKIEADKET